MKRMKKLLLTMLVLAGVMVCSGVLTCAYALELTDTIKGELDTENLENALPDSAEEILVNASVEDAESCGEIFKKIWKYVRENGGRLVRSALRSAVLVLAIAVLTSTVAAVLDEKGGYAVTGGIAAISAVTVSSAASFIALGRETLTQLSAFSTALLPTLASAAAMSGAYTSAGAKYAASMVFIDALMRCGEYLVIPMICAYLAAGIGSAAMGGEGLASALGFLKWLATTVMTALMIAFTGFLSITGVVSGSADAAVQRVAKTAIGAALPVVGGIVSDAAGAMAAGAGMIKNAIGVFGMAAVLAVCVTPVLKIGAGYLAYKAASGLAGAVADTRISKLLGTVGTAFGMILGLVGSAAAMLFISVILFMKAVM